MRAGFRALGIISLAVSLTAAGCSRPDIAHSQKEPASAPVPITTTTDETKSLPTPERAATEQARPVPARKPAKPAASPPAVPVAPGQPVAVAETLPAPPKEVPTISPLPEGLPQAALENTAPPSSVTPPQQPAPSVPEVRRITVPAGTRVTIRTTDPVDSRTDRVGQTFLASVDSEIVVDGQVVVPRKAGAYLRLTQASSAGELSGKSELRLQLESIAAGGKTYAVESSTIERSAEPEGPNTVRDVAITTAIGAAIGAIAGGGKGAAAGAAAGAGAGVAIAAITKGEQVLVRSETRLDFLLERPVEIEVRVAPPVAPAVSGNNSSSGPRRLGEGPAPLPRGKDEKEVHLTGEWDLTIEGPQGKRVLKMSLNQRGRSLSGSIEDRTRGNSVALHGSVDDDSISFTTVTEILDRKIEEHFTGTVAGNRLRGTMTIDVISRPERFPPRRGGGRGSAIQQRATWTARRVQ